VVTHTHPQGYQTNKVLPANGLGTWFGVRAIAGHPYNFVAHPPEKDRFLPAEK
jgi:hypothetical protein